MKNFVKVVNLKETAGERAPGGKSWIDFWRDNCADSDQFDEICCCQGCNGLAEHGAHVSLHGVGILFSLLEYIVPLCAGCNNPENTDPFDVPENFLVLIPS
ncbi:hypothetical protein [Aeromonas veronii]|uniref:hypothetical protein n=1 Tax=Aeromonas veronii TaxID=654 RepID=UPI00111A25CA|nr:hypothetical protein [Aeromonas veronii]